MEEKTEPTTGSGSEEYVLTPEIQAAMFDIFAKHFAGKSIRRIFREDNVGICRATFFNYLQRFPELIDHYRRAREGYFDDLHDQRFEKAEQALNHKIRDQWTEKVDPGAVKALELQIHTIEWSLGRAAYKKYGPKGEEESQDKGAGELPPINLIVQVKPETPVK